MYRHLEKFQKLAIFETEKLAMEEVNREFKVSLDEWEALNSI